jgi:hypothetical protein
MKILNQLNVIFVGIIMSTLCILITYLLGVDTFGWYDITGMKSKLNVQALAELHPIHTMWGLSISAVYIVSIAFVILGILFIKRLKKSRLWTNP